MAFTSIPPSTVRTNWYAACLRAISFARPDEDGYTLRVLPQAAPGTADAARIVLGAGARAGAAPIRIVPVGLTFEAKGLFRSRVLLQVGDAEVLLIRRAERPEDPWSGHMAFPGGRVEDDDPDLVSAKAKKRGISQLGTLGSGNHYLEIQVVHPDSIYDADLAADAASSSCSTAPQRSTSWATGRKASSGS